MIPLRSVSVFRAAGGVSKLQIVPGMIACEDCLAGSICRVQKGLDKYRRLSLLPYLAHHFQRMICPPSKQSVL